MPHKTTFDTLQNTSENVTKCHACHAKRSNETSETSKNDHLCRTYHRHGHTVLTRTVANGCARERNVERTHPQPPDPQSETGTLATHSGKKKDTSITCLKTVTCLQRQIFNTIAINLHACISTTSMHATFACISLTNTRKSPSCNISKNTIPHEL